MDGPSLEPPGQQPVPAELHTKTSVPKRRSKVTTACLSCRGRKLKCDGRAPTCSRCADLQRKGWTGACTWDGGTDGRRAAASSNPPPKRLKRLPRTSHDSRQDQGSLGRTCVTSASHQTSPAGQSSQSATIPPGPSIGTPSALLPGGGRVTCSSPSIRGPGAISSRNLEDRNKNSATVPSWYGELGRVVESDLGRCGRRFPLGSASVALLTTSITKPGASPEELPGDPFPTQTPGNHNGSLFREKRSLSEASYELPRRATVDALFATYWDDVHPLFPVLDMEETKQACIALWCDEPSSELNEGFLCIVNIILARTTRISGSNEPAARDELSNRYCGRALDLFNHGRAIPASLTSLQAALLIAEYLHSLHPEQCWMFTGVAIRMAQSLGIDRPRITSRIRNPRAVELCRRVWKLCVVWDRILCMTYGRSLMISQREADLTLSSRVEADEASSYMHSPDAGIESINDAAISMFLQRSLELYLVMGRALEDFSAWDLEQSHDLQYAAIHDVLARERVLTDWNLNLPSCIRIATTFSITRNPI